MPLLLQNSRFAASWLEASSKASWSRVQRTPWQLREATGLEEQFASGGPNACDH